jgi:hypothetical protein
VRFWTKKTAVPKIDPDDLDEIMIGFDIAFGEIDQLVDYLKSGQRGADDDVAIGTPIDVIGRLEGYRARIDWARGEVRGDTPDFSALASEIEIIGDELERIEDLLHVLPEGGACGCPLAWAVLSCNADRIAGQSA